MRHYVIVPAAAVLCGLIWLVSIVPATAQNGPPVSNLAPSLLDDLVAANRILAKEGVFDAFGHVSLRDPNNPNHYWMSRSLAPALVTAADIMEFDLDSNPIDGMGRTLYYERFIHGEIYKARPDVNAIVHSHSPTVVPFSAIKIPLQPLLHNAAFLSFGVPVFEIRRMVSNSDLMISTPALGAGLAKALGPKADVVLLRGHGDAVVGPSLPVAVFRAYYTEINARQQAQAIALGGAAVTYISPEEAVVTDKEMQHAAGRPWELWKREVMQK
jgi:HCOMODA/2-hydroxy-3-carboxy-muconic semialdehyde decarboxylase